MKFLKIFNRKKKEKIAEIEKISQGKIAGWCKNKTLILEKEHKVFQDRVNIRISELVTDIKAGITSLEDLDWDKIKVEDKIKLIVKENLDNYIGYLENLISEIENLGDGASLRSKFLSFERKAGKSYQKSTFLIGKELAVIQEAIQNFSKDLDRMKEENKELLDNFNVMRKINVKLENLQESYKAIIDLDGKIKNNEDRRDRLNDEMKDLREEIVKIKEGKEYQDWNKKKEDLEKNKVNLGGGMKNLKELIDFKLLAQTWHENEEEMKAVNEYKMSFETGFKKDKSGILKTLIQGLENKDKVNSKLEEVLKLKEEIINYKLEDSPDVKADYRINKILESLKSSEDSEAKERKRVEKLSNMKDKMFDEMGNDLKIFNVELG